MKPVFPFTLLAGLLLLSCSQTEKPASLILPDSLNGIPVDTLLSWKMYTESSDEGLWEGLEEHEVWMDLESVFGEELDPVFYSALFLTVSGDTILVSDAASERLVCLDGDGNLLWSAGGLGEGPGYFLGIGRSAIRDSLIAVCNNSSSAIDLYSRAGEFIRRFAVTTPQDVLFLNDTTLAVFSKANPGGDVHLFTTGGDYLESFGDGEWIQAPLNHAVFDLTGLYREPDRLAYMSQFDYQLVIYDLETRERVFLGARKLPAPVHGQEERSSEAGRVIYSYPVIKTLFIGPEGMINAVLPCYLENRQLHSPENVTDYAPVTVVDRYDWDGNYLDSYCIPDSKLNDIDYSDELGFVTRDWEYHLIKVFAAL